MNLLLLSWFLVAFAQPAWSPWLGAVAASFGYALFWKYNLSISRKPFLTATLFFTFVQAIQVSWMTTLDYMGPYILLIYAFVCLCMGLQFGILSYCLKVFQPLTFLRSLSLAGLWVIMEWIRQFPCTGFTWNPVGLAMTASPLSLQCASIFGIYGLSFWVILTNLTALDACKSRFTLRRWAFLAVIPFLFGAVRIQLLSTKEAPSLSALLVQPALLPHEKDFFAEWPTEMLPPLDQWERIFALLQMHKTPPADLIVLPEAALPYAAYRMIYPPSLVEKVWKQYFGKEHLSDLPPLGQNSSQLSKKGWQLSNAYLAQGLANRFQSEVIIGLDDQDPDGRRYNAAFHFMPYQEMAHRYEKQVLVPIAEYIPLSGWKFLRDFIEYQYGISDSFDAGSEAKVFSSRKGPFGISICYEETFPELTRQLKQKGATFFVNLSNDAYFPRSKLAQQHFDHGLVRATENGVPELRACSMGVTGAVDCFGRILKVHPQDSAGVLHVTIPLQNVFTFYSFWGDSAILFLSCIFLVVGNQRCRVTFLYAKKRLGVKPLFLEEDYSPGHPFT